LREWDYDSDGTISGAPLLSYDVQQTVSLLSDALQWAIGEAADPYGPDFFIERKHQRGRPAGTIKYWPLRAFVEELYEATLSFRGKLSFSPKNGASGSLVRALRLIEPSLPNGFLPKVLPAKSIERWIAPIRKKSPKK
jgi:hypothetical protein